MTRIVLTLLCALAISSSLLSQNDTVKIVFFQDSNIQQYKGAQWHRISKRIPKGSYRKAILRIDFGCATYGCCAWDYTYSGFFSEKTTDTSYRDIEIARLITPYSSFMRKGRYGYDSTWTHPYIYDVTDYLSLLHDSITYSALTGGWDDKGKFGFKHTVTLILVPGENNTPSTRVIPVHDKSYPYSDSSQFERLLPPFKFTLNENESFAKYRMIFTGHQQEGEFSPITFYLTLNGERIYYHRLWKTNCDQNAIQPQSGTWIFSRCNWCPGEKVEEQEIDLSPFLRKGENSLDLSLGVIETKDTPIHASYSIAGNLILYSSRPEYDAELVDIVSPNLDKRFNQNNPNCQSAIIRVKNNGNQTIRTLHFEYYTLYGAIRRHSWQGTILPLQSVDISLPMTWEAKDLISRTFCVKMIRSLQNSPLNMDFLCSSFQPAPLIQTHKPCFEIATTNDSTINTLILYNQNHEVVFRKNYYNNSTIYRDTVDLSPGCYRLELQDRDPRYECGDGLSFWYSISAYKKTSGSFKIYDGIRGDLLNEFNPDFGGKLNYQFIIDK